MDKERAVIFVDDDEHLIAAVRRSLHREPYRLLSATNAEMALQIMESVQVDVVVSDEQMPGMSGVEFLTDVRKRWPETVAIMLSGRASVGAIVRALNQGQIYRFLIKPCDNDELVVSVRQAMAHKLVMDRCRELLPLFRRQASLLAAIERRNPGITRQVQTEVGTILVKRDDFTGLDDLAERMDVEIRRGAGLLNE
jgi:DNA-binding NtrC family response regulator